MAKRKRYEDYLLLAPGEEVPGHQTRYVVERMVGTGGFAAVYSARDPGTPGRHIALKEFFAPRHPREQNNLRALFDRERIVGMQASSHPLMPTFYEAFAHDGYFYIAQEFIEGATLDEIIQRRHPLPRDWILKWAVCLCDALAFLHSRQIVHHDLKPANIRINPQGHLTLLDFGAAQYFGDGHDKNPPGDLYGTEGYLPPELEADGKWVADVRTDIFALGAILYEMIAGVAPDQEQINARSMYVTNSLMNRPNADLNLVKLINRALSYNTEYRYGSANDFLLEIRNVAPPVLLVSKKHLRWGEVSVGQTLAPKTVTLYNAGGGEIGGEIKPRAPWMIVPTRTFQGNKRDVTVRIDLSKVKERGQLVRGNLEINTPDVSDAEGKIVIGGDRWFVECNLTVLPQPGHLQVSERRTPGAPPISLAGRKGQALSGTFELRNTGETPVDFTVGRDPTESLPVLEITPDSGTVAASQASVITVRVPTADLNPTAYETAITVRTNANQTLSVPFVIQVHSAMDFLKSIFGKRGA